MVVGVNVLWAVSTNTNSPNNLRGAATVTKRYNSYTPTFCKEMKRSSKLTHKSSWSLNFYL